MSSRLISWTHLGREAVLAASEGRVVTADGPVYDIARGRTIGDIALVRGRHSPVSISPAPPRGGSDPRLSVAFVISGEVRVPAMGVRVGAGEVAAYIGTPPSLEYPEPIDYLHVAFPPDAFATHGIDLSGVAHSRPLRSPAVAATRAFLLALVAETADTSMDATDALDDSDDAITADIIVHLVATLFAHDLSRDGIPVRKDEDVVERARRAIAAGAHDPALSAERLARQVGVPLRTLQRRFERAGSSISAELRRRRLMNAEEILRRNDEAPIPIDVAARRAGFSSTRHLREAMKASYGLTPRHLRGWSAR